jgi:methionyl-tRNA formyltransferase
MLSDYLATPENYPAIQQIGEPSFTHKFTSDDFNINWNKSSRQIHNQVRALGFGRTKINGMDVKVLKTKITDDHLEILSVQPSGKKSMNWVAFINGQHGIIELGK